MFELTALPGLGTDRDLGTFDCLLSSKKGWLVAEGKRRLKDKCKHVKSCDHLIFKGIGRGDQETELN